MGKAQGANLSQVENSIDQEAVAEYVSWYHNHTYTYHTMNCMVPINKYDTMKLRQLVSGTAFEIK